jgi:hypothetical protein
MMKDYCVKPAAGMVATALITLFFMLPGTIRAQRNIPPLLNERERMQRENDQRLGPPTTDHQSWFSDWPSRQRAWQRLTAAQIKRDAERIQFFNRQMMGSVAPGMALDYKTIVKATGEIKKRANRLRINLRLPRDRDVSKSKAENEELRDDRELAASLSRLDDLVRRLGASPLLVPANKHVLDVKQATAAVSDLENIIVLSERIRKSAKSLNEARRRSH